MGIWRICLTFKTEHSTLEKVERANIYVSFLAEQGVNIITMSGTLRHRSSKVIDKYLSLNYYKSSQEGLDVVSEFLETSKL